MKKNTFKKLIALVLGIVMLSSVVLTSCKKEEQEPDEEYRTPYSFVMTLVSEKPVSAETEKLIEDAFNAITESKFKTRVDLRFYTEDVYFDSIMATIDKFVRTDNTKVDVPVDGEETTAVEEETIINEEYGYSEFKYPEIKENQLDIIYINGAGMYSYFIEGNSDTEDETVLHTGSYLAKLDTPLSTGSKVLNDYIFPEFLQTVKANEITYAIPNNNIATDYTYMLVNKELAQKYQYLSSISTWTGLSSAAAYIEDVAKYEKGVLPIFGELTPINFHNWSYEIVQKGNVNTYNLVNDRFSVFGASLSLESNIDTVVGFGNTLTSSYGTQLQTIQDYKDKTTPADSTVPYNSTTLKDGQSFALGFIKGNEGDVISYRDEYEVIVVEKPRMTAETIYGNMFGVFSNMSEDTARVNRCMEIITLINTDVEARNILQYGIEGVHYRIDDKTGVLERLNQDYIMDVNKTGNVLLAHAEEGLAPETVDYMRQQNIDADLYPTSNVLLNLNEIDPELVKEENALSKKYDDMIKACKNLEELKAVIDEFKVDPAINALKSKWFGSDVEPFSPYQAYYNWLVDEGKIDLD